ncbi:MAG: xylulokinase [Ruminococcaceae bacterium]|nr:xylulokinase [Oscillospiraceae bacterium]
MKYVIGIDLGTSGTKTVLFDQTGKVIASQTIEYPLYQPQNGWAEQEPDDWVNAGIQTIAGVMAQSGVDAADVAAIGLSGQMHGLVMLDENGDVLRKSIIWCDQRTGEECREITEIVGAERLIEITANPALTGFTLSKLLWVRKHEPELYARCRHILLPKDYLRYRLTGTFATDVSDASGMQMLDIPGRRWSEELLKTLDIDPFLLGTVLESCECSGYVTEAAAALTGLKAGTPVAAGAGDNAAAAVGVGVVRDGKAFTTIGTSGVVFAHTDKISIDPKGRVHTFCCAVPGAWHLMGVTQAAGLSLRWLRDTVCTPEVQQAAEEGVDPYEIMTAEAAKSPIGANRLLYLPYLMGERTPHLDPDCRGVFFGLSAMHERGDLIRSVMEGVSYSLTDCVRILQDLGVDFKEMIACGGGGTSTLWRSMLAGCFDLPVRTAVSKEGPALGAAILAAVCAGLYPDVPTACDAMVAYNAPMQPADQAAYAAAYERYIALYPALKQQYADLAAL